ncbi:MAG: calcium/sodium antiporter [Victivallaceae bacterium]|nr:calcium/sodium antiporter [Victivallaceae bacterium]
MSFASGFFLLNVMLFLFGLLLLVKGSDFFVEAASRIARNYKIPEIVIGLTLVSIGTSLPEFGTDVYASIKGQSGIVVGDLVGSNITNISLVLGVAVVLLGSMPSPRAVVKRDATFMLGVFFVVAALGFAGNGRLGRTGGGIMLLLMTGYLFYLFKHRDSLAELEEGEVHHPPAFHSVSVAWLFLAVGTVMIFSGAKTMVDNVVAVAERFQVSPGLIAATIVAFGTSVPELAVTVTSIRKRKNGIALGNIIGSCTFNLLLIMGLCAVISPLRIEPGFQKVIIPVMLLCGTMLVVFMRTGWRLVKTEGIAFLLLYLAYLAYNCYAMF